MMPGQFNIEPRLRNNVQVEEREDGEALHDFDDTAAAEKIAELEAELAQCKAMLERVNGNEEAYNDAITQALEDVKAIRVQAEKEADFIINQANMDRDNIVAEAEKEGYEKGFQKGIVDGKFDSAAKAKEGLDEIAYFIEMLNMERMQTCHEEEESLSRLAFEIARKIMRQQIKVEKEAVPRMIEDVVKENEDAVKIVLSEYNETLFTRIDRRTREKIKELLPNIKVLVVPNDGMTEIIQIETKDGMVDAAVEGQLERLEEAIRDDDYSPSADL